MVRSLEFSAEASQALASQLGGLAVGCGEDITTPLIPRTAGKTKEALRGEVADSVTQQCNLGNLAGRLRSLELEKRSKHGTFSKCPGFRISTDRDISLERKVRKYFEPRETIDPSTKSMVKALERVASLYSVARGGRIPLLDLVTAATSLSRSTGLGFPVCCSDFETYGFRMYQVSEEIHNSGYDPAWVAELPAILGRRGTPFGPPSVVGTFFAKVRAIHAQSRALMNVEKELQAPVQGRLSRRPEFVAWRSRGAVARQITRLFSSLPNKRKLSVDFKSFDVSVRSFIIDLMFDIIKGWCTEESGPVIDFCKEVMNRTGIICPGLYLPGEARTGGVPSGSVNTNLIDSLANLFAMHYAADRCGTEVIFALSQGDDGVYAFQGNPTLADLCSAVSELGMTISEEKSMYEVHCVHYLQDLHESSHVVDGLNVGMRPIMHILNSMMSHERIDGKPWDRDDDTVRWLQQLGEAQYHPSFTLACDWLLEADWMCAGIVKRICDNDRAFLERACAHVNRKDSNSFWGLTPESFLSSPVVQYLTKRHL